MAHTLETSLTLPLSRREVFAFFADPANLQLITPPELRFRIVTPLPVLMAPGARIEYRLRLLGIPFGWKTLISRWEPPFEFIDEQIEGPYRAWVHRHRFRKEGGATVMEDRVKYELPFYPWGEWVHFPVRKQLERIFDYRRETVFRLLSAR